MLVNKLILFYYLLQQFGFDKFETLQAKFKDDELEADTTGNSIFYTNLSDKVKFSRIHLKEYDENIISYLNQINRNRNTKINLKYFQYFSLLFTEYYLHHYFEDKNELLERLNEFKIEYFRKHRIGISKNPFPDFEIDKLNLIAYWNATGSGKTFILHFNILQYKNYCKNTNNLILLTPSEYLSKQHKEDLELSGIDVDYYLNNKIGNHVKIIDIYKIKGIKKGQGVTISVSEFDQNNCVFVDEGHKGSATEESIWRKLRETMGYNGFTFEYSATFGQIVNDDLKNDYAKAIIFDYSYRHFYKDGYGKDYWIHNISDNKLIDSTETRRKYLLLNLLLFTQQKLFFITKKDELAEYQIENPLLIFVGHTVNPKATSKVDKDDNKITVSDVKIILEFFHDFLNEKDKYINWIKEIANNKGLFSEDYNIKLSLLFNNITSPNELYSTVLQVVFNNKTPDRLELYTLRNANGEIALKIHNSENYFGLINIGDTSTFKTRLSKEFIFETDSFNTSLFDTLSARASNPVNILIGARKFIEGWNNYRVSSIGLINFGRSEGAQIIQLFGRGIRLNGKNNSLKRTVTGEGINNIRLVETLNIFGLNADYMKRFKDDLEKEGIKTITRKITVPTELINNSPKNLNDLKLITLSKKENIPDFNTTDIFELKTDEKINILLDLSTEKYLYASSNGKTQINYNLQSFKINEFFDFIDFDNIYFKLLSLKNLKGFYNLRIIKENIKDIIKELEYKIIADEVFTINSISDINKLNKIVYLLLKQYTETYYNRYLRVYEGDKLQTRILEDTNSVFKDIDYEIEIIETDKDGNILPEIDNILSKIEKLLSDKDYPKNLKGDTVLLNTWFDNHLFQPLLKDEECQNKIKIESISPKGLNVGESKFVEHLQTYLSAFKDDRYPDCEFYLLRNFVRSKGFGFYFSSSGGFYPDFLLWIKKDDKQYLSFIDPHGLRNEKEGFNSDKIQLHKNIKELEKSPEIKEIILNSFILSPSTFAEAGIDRWHRPSPLEINLYEYANSLNIFEIGQKGSERGETNYIGEMIERILS